jgi:hypothetical protein
MSPATFEWDDDNIEHIALHGVDIMKPKQYSTIDHSYYELKTISIWLTDSRTKVATCLLSLLARLRASALSVLAT